MDDFDLTHILQLLQKREADDKRRAETLRAELAAKEQLLQQRDAALRQLLQRKARAAALLGQAKEVLDGTSAAAATGLGGSADKRTGGASNGVSNDLDIDGAGIR